MIRCVLSTDMSTHFDVTNKFKLLVDSKQYHKDEDQDRQSAMNFLMHSVSTRRNPPPQLDSQGCL